MTRARKRTANPGKYAGKAYLSYEESTDFLGISLSTLVRYIADEKLQTRKFHRDKKRYLAIEDVKRIEDLIMNPWKRTVPQEQISGSIPTTKETVTGEHPWYLPEQKEESTSEEDKPEPDAA
jgi:hypothetical protein